MKIVSQENDDGNQSNKQIAEYDIEKIIEIPDDNIYKFRIRVVDSQGHPVPDASVILMDVRLRKNDLAKIEPLTDLSLEQKLEKFKQLERALVYGDKRTNKKGMAKINLWLPSESLKKQYSDGHLTFAALKEGYVDYGYGSTSLHQEKKSSASVSVKKNKTIRAKITLYKGDLINVRLKGMRDDRSYLNRNYMFSIRSYDNQGYIEHLEYLRVSKGGKLVDRVKPHNMPAFPDLPGKGYLAIELSYAPAKKKDKDNKKYIPIKKKIPAKEYQPGEIIHLNLKKNPDYDSD